MKVVETGVDKLLELVKREKMVSYERASEVLGVSTKLIDEWVVFLEKGNLISTQYKMFKPYIVDKRYTKEEKAKKKKEFDIQKQVFSRRVETALKGLEQDNIRLEKFKKSFDKLKEEISGEIESVKNELNELDKIDKQRAEINQKLNEIKLNFAASESALDKKLLQKLLSHKKLLDVMHKKRVSRQKLEILENKIRSHLENSFKEDKDKLLELLKTSREHQEKINSIKKTILDKIREAKRPHGKKIQNKIIGKFELFFEKKNQITKQLEKLSLEEKELQSHIQELYKQIDSIEYTEDRQKIVKELNDFEQQLYNLNLKRKALRQKLNELMQLI